MSAVQHAGRQPRESSAAVVLPESQIKSGLCIAAFLWSIDGRGPGIGLHGPEIGIYVNPASGRNLSKLLDVVHSFHLL